MFVLTLLLGPPYVYAPGRWVKIMGSAYRLHRPRPFFPFPVSSHVIFLSLTIFRKSRLFLLGTQRRLTDSLIFFLLIKSEIKKNFIIMHNCSALRTWIPFQHIDCCTSEKADWWMSPKRRIVVLPGASGILWPASTLFAMRIHVIVRSGHP